MYNLMKREVVELARHTFLPEFLNRVDEYIVFQPFDSLDIKKIVEIQVMTQHPRVSSCVGEIISDTFMTILKILNCWSGFCR